MAAARLLTFSHLLMATLAELLRGGGHLLLRRLRRGSN
jgi:hypothetical protein